MAFALRSKSIYCPNCNYEGKAKVIGTGCAGWIVFVALFIISLFFWPFFIITFLTFLYLMFKPAKQICPKCSFENPIPIAQWQSQVKTAKPQPEVPLKKTTTKPDIKLPPQDESGRYIIPEL